MIATLVAVAGLDSAAAFADSGKVLVFTGTAGSPNAADPAAVSAINAVAAANGLTADATSDATSINAAKLAGYRAVVFVNSSGDVLNAAEEADLQSYVQGGGGFVGIGETALLEQGNAFFDTLLGLTGASRTSGSSSSATDLEFLDRVHPASKGLPILLKSHSDAYYTWTNNPTGLVHTVARARLSNIPLPDGSSVTNDAVSRFTGTTAQNQPQGEVPVSWCRDIQGGRSFYTDLGRTAEAYSDGNLQKQLSGAVSWAAGLVRGNCKATINSNYSVTRLSPPNPTTTDSPYAGELTNGAIAADGRVFYTGRAVCSAAYAQQSNWTLPNVGLGCGTIYVWDRGQGTQGSDDQDPAKVNKVASLTIFGAKTGNETGVSAKDEQGLLAFSLDPKFTEGRPYFYIQYFPYYGGEQGVQGGRQLGGGFDRNSYTAERRISRFTYDSATHSIAPGSEKVIMSWRTQVYSCCHVGASMAWDSAGNLYVTNGDNTGNNPNGADGGYTNSDEQYTIPCPGAAPLTACGTTDHPGTSFADARQTSGNTNAYEGKIIRIHPLDDPGDTPGVGTTYTIPGANAPNGGNLYAPDSDAVVSGKAKPEVFAMGVRNDYTIHIDPKTDAITTAWVGPDQGTDSSIWGPAKTENAVMFNKAGNYGWPFCQAGRWDYRAKLPGTAPGIAAPVGAVPGTVGGGVDGQTGAYWDCSQDLENDSPYNTGLKMIPKAQPTNVYYGPQGGCYGYKVNANGVPLSPDSNTAPSPQITRACPWANGGSQAPIDGGVYRKPAGDHPTAWPGYWDGRWFLVDFAGANNMRHALLMDPATEFKGGQPVSADSLYGIMPTSLWGGNRIIHMDWGPDGDLYVLTYSGSNFTISNANDALWRVSYTGGADTPGADPKATPAANSASVTFGVGASGGVSYAWKFDDGGSATGADATHAFLAGGTHTATLTVTYADGVTDSKDVSFTVPPSASTTVGGNVPATLALSLGSPASFGAFAPGVTKTYDASLTANVVSTAGDAALSVVDPATLAPGRLLNGTFALPSALRAKATDAAHPGTAFAGLSGSPLNLLAYSAPVSSDAVNVQFQQAIDATDALRTGSYAKTLTFTLSTTTP